MNRILIIMKKEMRDMLRDRRSLFFMLVFPLLIIPLIMTGIPTVSGMSVFVLSYLAVSRGIVDIPPALTLITSASCFFIGLIGLSYGILSSSWEPTPGSILGFENIRPNIKRVKEAFSSLNKMN